MLNLLGCPIEEGAGQRGSAMGPAAYRTAGLTERLRTLGHKVTDLGDVSLGDLPDVHAPAPARNTAQVAAWSRAIAARARALAETPGIPIYLGGDHALSLGTLAGHAAAAKAMGRPLFVLWLDAHPDFNTFETTESGNLHGTPLAFACGLPGGETLLGAPLEAPVDARNICLLGLRSIDPAEHGLLATSGAMLRDMRAIDEHGITALLEPFLDRVIAEDGLLHVSLDVDFLDPGIAPAVGTTIPGGATFREAHLVMELLHDCARVTSLDLVELNPFLDLRGQTANLMVDLTASLFGQRVLDRTTRSF
ncbi:MAG: arginase [Mangrovicoccus sp.]|nr:arginase [Mangrovicoccus sp.]